MPVGACGIACACACMPVCVYFEERSCTTALCLFIQTAVCDEGLATPPDKKTSSSVHPGRGVLMYRLSLSLLLPSPSLNLSSPHTHTTTAHVIPQLPPYWLIPPWNAPNRA